MKKNDFYQTIFERKSIRNYDLTPLDENTLNEIKECLRTLKPFYSDIETELKILSSDEVKRRMMKKAPHYIAVFSQTKEGYLINVGFMVQQMDLFFSANCLGSCWQGIPKPKPEVLNNSDLEFVILMAFGKSNVPLHRNSTSEFKRKSLQEITDNNGAFELLEAARLAPSATNRQPWFFSGDESIIHVYSFKPNRILAILVKNYISIDIGIALYHLKLAAEHFGKTTNILFDKRVAKNPPKGYEYVTSLEIE
jgi:nitroreductase